VDALAIAVAASAIVVIVQVDQWRHEIVPAVTGSTYALLVSATDIAASTTVSPVTIEHASARSRAQAGRSQTTVTFTALVATCLAVVSVRLIVWSRGWRIGTDAAAANTLFSLEAFNAA
jgi:hypothetical protein